MAKKEVTELSLTEKTVEKIKNLLTEQQKLQATLIDTVQTILDHEGLDGQWDFAKTEQGIDISKLVKKDDKLTEGGN